MEDINYDIMRLDLDDNNYVINVYFGCASGGCVGYNGEVPDGYETLEEWYEENCNCAKSWRLVNGNLVFDVSRHYELESLYKKQEKDNACVKNKDFYQLQSDINDIYRKDTVYGNFLYLPDVRKCSPRIKLSNFNCYDNDKITLIISGKNMLVNEAYTQTINGITFTQNDDRSITINGTATADIEYNIAGTSVNTSPFLCLKKNKLYYLTDIQYELKMYYFDGVDREEVYSTTGGRFYFDEDKPITHITLNIPSGTTISDETVYLQLEHSLIATEYEAYKGRTLTIDYSQFIGNGLFPSETLYPSESLFPLGTAIDILIEQNSIYAYVEGQEYYLQDTQLEFFDNVNVVYTYPNASMEIECSFRDFKQETMQITNLLDNDGGKILSSGGLITLLKFDSNIKSYNFMGGTIFLPLYFSGTNNTKDSLEFNFDIPDNFTMTNAYIKLEHMPLINRGVDMSDTTGYCRNLKLYKATTQSNGKVIINWSYGERSYSNTNFEEIVNAFGSDGFTGSDDGYTYAISQDISQDITKGNNMLRIQTGNNLGTFDYKKCGAARATLYVYGYIKIAKESEE